MLRGIGRRWMLVHLGNRESDKKGVANQFSFSPPWHHYMNKEARGSVFSSASGLKELVDFRQITHPLGVSEKLQFS